MRLVECLVGDDTGMIIFKARNDQVDLMKECATVILRNAKIDMFKELIRLAVDYLTVLKQKEQLNENPEVVAGLGKGIIHLAFQCLKEAIVRQRMLLFFIEQHPLLERVCITDSKKRGMLSLRNEKLVEVRNWIGFNLDTIGSELKSIEVPVSARQWCVPVLDLPLSGYMVQGATLVLMGMGSGGDGGSSSSGGGGGSFDNGIEILEGLELGEDAFGEAVKEIMLNHRSEMKILL